MNFIESIGKTPLVEIPVSGYNSRIRFLAKLEGANPGGSVKDRVAYYMVKKGLESGQLTRDKIILEATTGNTGVSLAWVSAAMGLKLKVCMPGSASMEFRMLIKVFGAELLLTPVSKGLDGAILKAYEVFEHDPERYFMANQFNNGANPQAHYETTGVEIWEQSQGQVTHFVAGMGTTGTLMGVGRRLKEHFPGVQIIGVEPVKNHQIQGLRDLNVYYMPLPGVYDPSKIHRIIPVNDEQALQALETLIKKHGMLLGPTSGAAFHGALELAKDAPAGSTIITVFPDRADRYMGTAQFKTLLADSPDESHEEF